MPIVSAMRRLAFFMFVALFGVAAVATRGRRRPVPPRFLPSPRVISICSNGGPLVRLVAGVSSRWRGFRSQARLLPGDDGGRGLEDGGRRAQLEERLRWLLRHRLGRRGGGLVVGSERRLRGNGGILHSRERFPRRRRLQVHRRGKDVDSPGARRDAAHRPHPHPPEEPRYRLRRRSRGRLRTERGARGLSNEGRRAHVAKSSLSRQGQRRHRSHHGSGKPGRDVRIAPRASAFSLGVPECWTGHGSLQDDRRGRPLDRAHRQSRPSHRAAGTHRRRDLPGKARACLGDHRRRHRKEGCLPLR